jgi:non-ribosomal peptide synthetase component F
MKPIGLFINTLVLRSHVSSELSYRDFLSQIKTTTLDAYHHQELYFDSLVDLLKPERSPSDAPLVQVLFSYVNLALTGGFKIPGVAVSQIHMNVIPKALFFGTMARSIIFLPK